MPYLEDDSDLYKTNKISIDFFKWFIIHKIIYEMLNWNSENKLMVVLMVISRLVNLIYGAY